MSAPAPRTKARGWEAGRAGKQNSCECPYRKRNSGFLARRIATLDFIAPSTTTAGIPFTVTVNVLYEGKPDTVINSHIHFTSSDPAAVLPPDYYFTRADASSHTRTNGFTLSTPTSQTISGAIFGATGINGNASISVSP